VAERLDLRTSEHAEREEPRAALHERRVPERLPLAQLQLALDRSSADPSIPHDDDVVDDHLGTFRDIEQDIGECIVLENVGSDVTTTPS
jgi:hypothetical protein